MAEILFNAFWLLYGKYLELVKIGEEPPFLYRLFVQSTLSGDILWHVIWLSLDLYLIYNLCLFNRTIGYVLTFNERGGLDRYWSDVIFVAFHRKFLIHLFRALWSNYSRPYPCFVPWRSFNDCGLSLQFVPQDDVGPSRPVPQTAQTLSQGKIGTENMPTFKSIAVFQLIWHNDQTGSLVTYKVGLV